MRAVKSGKQDASRSRRPTIDSSVGRLTDISSPVDDWADLPPLADLVDGVNRFTRYYFQLGFIPKRQFEDQLWNDRRSVNFFLLLSILSISARLSPALSKRFGGGIDAAKYFMNRASSLAMGEIYETPSLERCQAFYLLSIAQQGSGDCNRSYVRCVLFHISKSSWKLTLIDQHGYLSLIHI